MGQRLEPDRAVLACRVVEADQWCRWCGCEGAARDTVVRRLAHEPFGWRPTVLEVTARRYRCTGCGHVWRQDTTLAAEPRSKLSRGALAWALRGLVVAHLSMSQLGVDTLPFVRAWGLIVSGVVFCAVTSFLGGTSLLMGAITQSWVPYLAVPFAVGFAAVRITVFRAGLLGALSSVLLVIGFYAVSPFDTWGLPVDTESIFREYGPPGIVTGFILAASSRSIAPRVARAPGRWALAFCSILTLALIASWSILGWGVHEVTTSSGVVTVGASTADVIASSAVVLAYSCAVIVLAIHGLPRAFDQRVPTEQSARPGQDHREHSE